MQRKPLDARLLLTVLLVASHGTAGLGHVNSDLVLSSRQKVNFE